MSTLDENIFGRIALINSYLTREQLEECLQVQRSESPPRRIGQILLERGYLSDEQLQSILDICKQKLRKVNRSLKDAREGDRRFGELAITEGIITLDDLEEAILEQQRLTGLNLHFRIGEILVARFKMKAADVLHLLGIQGRRILVCPVCDIHYNVSKFQEDRMYQCVRCQARMLVPKFLDTIAVDAFLEGP
jgi:hypothetical protein